jgi:exodeoxyribonuclease V beta subunit
MNDVNVTPQAFSVTSSPVRGRVLLEASAGTGKTFSVTKIALRYLLAGTALPNILLVTFTNLATAELRAALSAELYAALQIVEDLVERSNQIGKGIRDALQSALEQDHTAAETRILLEIFANLADEDLISAQQRLQIAVKSTDLAAVWTLHQFAIQVMADNTFSVSQPFGQTVELEVAPYETQAILDFMRLHYVNNDESQSESRSIEEVSEGSQPALPVLTQAQLLNLLQLQRNKPDIQFYDRYEAQAGNDGDVLKWQPSAEIEHYRQQAEQAFSAVLQEYHQTAEEFANYLRDIEPTCSKSTFKADRRELIVKQLDIWSKTASTIAMLQDIKSDKPAHISNSLFSLAADYFSTKVITKKHQDDFEPPKLMQLVESFREVFVLYQRQRSAAKSAFIHYASCWLLQRFELLLSKDYITEASAAFRFLAEALSGESGASIAAQIRQKFSLTIVDEFQDTDPLQFEILDKLFPDKVHHNLVLVGDPKQAIYQFRGADIYAYLAVIHSANIYYYLDTNFRSDALLVAGVNSCFFDNEHGKPSFVLENIQFTEVKAIHSEARLQVDSALSSIPLQVCLQPSEMNAEKARNNALAETGRQIQQLLTTNSLITKNDQQRALTAADIAVLVNSNNDAKAVYRYCQSIGLPSVLHSADSVYQSDIAKPLLWLLQTIACGGRSDYLTTLMMTDFFAMTADEIVAEKASSRWVEYLNALQIAHMTWQQQGIGKAIHALSDKMAIEDRLLLGNQTRHIADFEHLVELIHQYEQEHQADVEQLLQWFQKRVLAEAVEDDLGAEVAQRRIDTDDAAITIITIHKSKGLEYPVVFCPFLHKMGGVNRYSDLSYHTVDNAAAKVENQNPHYKLMYVADGKAPHIDSSSLQEMQKQSAKEVLAEKVRLLYVAMTRASMRLILIDQCQSPKYHPMQHLLGNDALEGQKSEQNFLNGYQTLADKAPNSIAVTKIAEVAGQPNFQDFSLESSTPELSVSVFERELQPSWIFTSFSALKSASEKRYSKREGKVDIASVDEDRLAESSTVSNSEGNAEVNSLVAGANASLATKDAITANSHAIADLEAELEVELESYRFRYPAGAQYGTLIHNAFEEISLADFGNHSVGDSDKIVAVEGKLQQLITNANLPKSVDASELRTWLAACSHKKLSAGFSLADISDTALPEIEFLLPITELGLQRFQTELRKLTSHFPEVDRWLDEHPLQLQAFAPRGYIKGFIDLTLRHDGRYAILDYKSNHLGNEQLAYQSEALRAVMVETGYWLQFVIYSLALHRWLSQRLPDYSYEKHMLGGVFMFLRGIDHNTDIGEGEFFACLSEIEMDGLDKALAS